MKELKMYPKKSKKPLQAIRYFCFECMGWSRLEEDGKKPFEGVRDCTDIACPLYDFRTGKNPFHTRSGGGNTEALKQYWISKKVKL